jgi:aminoglycoside phosphotransferase family enzyme/predicted kinase
MSKEDIQKNIVDFLSDKNNYPKKTKSVEHKETHISHIFLTDKFAYKIKKPVNFGFLDFTSLQKRKFYCSEEIRLNKRLSPSLYLGVDKITFAQGQIIKPDIKTKKEKSSEKEKKHYHELFEFNGTGKAVEYAVKMKRLPEECIMTKVVESGNVNEAIIAKIAKIIADFHEKERTVNMKKNIAMGNGCVIAAKGAAMQNFSQTEKYIGTLVKKTHFEFIKNATELFFKTNDALFERRINANKNINIHGDLHTGNIFIKDDDIFIFDCIEFNNDFRQGDTVNDIAFLAMDLDYLRREDLSKYFIRKYVEFSGDNKVYTLLNFFKCYRAYVRAKVSSFMYDDPSNTKQKKEEFKNAAKKYYFLALEYARSFYLVKPVIAISCGVSGSGKSRWLKFASDIIGGEMLVTDAIRKKLFNLTGKEKKDNAYRKRYYSEENRQLVYDYIFSLIDEILLKGGRVSIDASFIKRKNRDIVRAFAKKHNAAFILIYTLSSEENIKRRINQRKKLKSNISDADFKHAYLYQKNAFEKPCKDEKPICINTDRSGAKNLTFLKYQIAKIIKQ